MVERSAVNRLVVGSNPTSGATSFATSLPFARNTFSPDITSTPLKRIGPKNGKTTTSTMVRLANLNAFAKGPAFFLLNVGFLNSYEKTSFSYLGDLA